MRHGRVTPDVLWDLKSRTLRQDGLPTRLSGREAVVFAVGTADDVSRLPAELSRDGRSDGVQILDPPGRGQLDAIRRINRDAIRRINRDAFAIPPTQPRPGDRGRRGAEVAACCRLSVPPGVPLAEAAKHVVPVSVAAAAGGTWPGRRGPATRGSTDRRRSAAGSLAPTPAVDRRAFRVPLGTDSCGSGSATRPRG